MSKRIKRVPLVIVHDSSSSDTDQEPVPAAEPERVSSIYFDSDQDNMSLSSEQVDPTSLETTPHENNAPNDPYSDPQVMDSFSKYSILKQDRLYCNFNPSVTSSRGCQTNFANHEAYKLITHLNTFHGCQIDQPDSKSESSDKFYSPLNDHLTLTGTDTEIYKDTDDSDLYLENVLNCFLNIEQDTIENQPFINQQESMWKENTKESSTVSLSQLEYKKATSPLFPLTFPKEILPSSTQPLVMTQPLETAQPLAMTESLMMTQPLETAQPLVISQPLETTRPLETTQPLEWTQPLGTTQTLQTTRPLETPQPLEWTQPMGTTQPTTSVRCNPKRKKLKVPIISKVTPKLLRSVSRQNKELEEPKEPEIKIPPMIKEQINIKKRNNKRKATTLETGRESKRKIGLRPKRKTSLKQAVGLDSGSSTSNGTTSLESTPEISKVRGYKAILPLPAESSEKSKLVLNQSLIQFVEERRNAIKKNTEERQNMLQFIHEEIATVRNTEKPNRLRSIDDETVAIRDTKPGTEILQVIPSIPTDGTWPFEFGYGFFMKQKYHCNVTRSDRLNGCKLTFANRSVFIQHLHHVHQLNASNAMSSRESEEDNLHEKIIDMLISANLPSSFVENKRFLSMIKSIQEISSEKHIMPSLQETENLMKAQFKKRRNQIKSLLREQDHISFSIHTFHPLHHSKDIMIVITAFYMDTEWRMKELIIQFKTLIDSSGDLNNAIESSFIETIQQFDIVNKLYLIVSPDSPTVKNRGNNTPVMFRISTDISKQVMMPCLDQVIQNCKTLLCRDLDTTFEPLQKILNFKAKICVYSWKGTRSEDIAKIVNFSNYDSTTFIDLLKEFTKVTREYNSVCLLNTRYNSDVICHGKMEKIEKLLKSVATLDESYAWLVEATNRKYPVANKILLIYTEILNILYQLAKCYGCTDESDILCEKIYSHIPSEKSIVKNINESYTVVAKYRTLMECSIEKPAWKGLISDPFSFFMYTARKQFYLKPMKMTPILLMNVINDKDHMISSIDSMAIELKNCIGETDRSEKSSLSDDSMTDFKNVLKAFLDSESNIQTNTDNNSTMLTHFLNHHRNNLGQLNFWKDAGSNVNPCISDIAKQCFPVPVTTFKCLQMAEEAEDHYAGIAYLFPKASVEENQQRTLLYIWQKYTDF